MNDEDQFRWLAHEFTADLNLSEAKEQEFADILKRAKRYRRSRILKSGFKAGGYSRASGRVGGSARFHHCGTTTFSTYLLGVKLRDALVRSTIWIQRI
jgi:hypothetical protein